MSDDFYHHSTTTAVLRGATTGAVMGAAVATATHLKQRSTPEAAMNDIVRTSLVTGVVTATATLVSQQLRCQHPVPKIAAMFVTGTALFYLLNSSKSAKSLPKLTHQPVVSGESHESGHA